MIDNIQYFCLLLDCTAGMLKVKAGLRLDWKSY